MTAGYWEERARRHGPRAAVNLDHPAGALERVSAGHRELLLPLLATRLRGDERAVLDLGCGPGRLTAALGALVARGRAIGVDPTPAMLALAPAAPGVEYRRMEAGRLPLTDGEVDVAFTCLVLGGVLDPPVLARTAGEVERVLAPGGLVLLAESEGDGPAAGGHWAPRSVADYRAAFPWAGLEVAARFDDGGDPVVVLVGRRPA